jgi:hypothetical protein
MGGPDLMVDVVRSGKEAIGLCVALVSGKDARQVKFSDHVQDGPKDSSGFYWEVTQLISEHARTEERRKRWEYLATISGGEDVLRRDPDFQAFELALVEIGRCIISNEPTIPPMRRHEWEDLNEQIAKLKIRRSTRLRDRFDSSTPCARSLPKSSSK